MESPRISQSTVQTFRRAVALLDVPVSEGKAAVRILEQAAVRPNQTKPQGEGPTGPRLIKVAEAAKRLSCSRSTVNRMLDDGLLTRRYLRPGNVKSLRIAAAEVDALAKGEAQDA
jgi:excisionase family DNA binding protein